MKIDIIFKSKFWCRFFHTAYGCNSGGFKCPKCEHYWKVLPIQILLK